MIKVEELQPNTRVLLMDEAGEPREVEIHSLTTVDGFVVVVWWNISNNHRTYVGATTFQEGEVIDGTSA